jgi:hypothetical protein
MRGRRGIDGNDFRGLRENSCAAKNANLRGSEYQAHPGNRERF